MSELDRQTGGLEYPRNRTTIDAAQREATTQILEETNRAYRQAVANVIAEAKETTDSQTLRFASPFVEESIRQFGRHMLDQQDAAISHVERVAAEYRSRIHY